jgi:hypothetical protein
MFMGADLDVVTALQEALAAARVEAEQLFRATKLG